MGGSYRSERSNEVLTATTHVWPFSAPRVLSRFGHSFTKLATPGGLAVCERCAGKDLTGRLDVQDRKRRTLQIRSR